MTYKYRVCIGHETLAEFEHRRAAMAYAADWAEANETVRVDINRNGRWHDYEYVSSGK